MIDCLATEPQYAAHLRPVYDALPDDLRGQWLTSVRRPGAGDAVVVASYSDHRRARAAGYKHIAVMEHGIGQSYSNDHPSYPGGRDRGDAEVFMTPNQHSAERWRQAYPGARVEVIGSPILDTLAGRDESEPETVAVSFHWDCRVAPETRSARAHFESALPDLAREFNLIVHAHPRIAGWMSLHYKKLGIEFVETFDEVLRRASVYVCDNSSTIFEFASTGRPVVLLNPPSYRLDIRHGLRFWDAAMVGFNVADPQYLTLAVANALYPPSLLRRLTREAALSTVYAYPSGAAERAADVLQAWAYGALAA